MRGSKISDEKRQEVITYITSGLNSVDVSKQTGVSSRSIRRIWENHLKEQGTERLPSKAFISLGAGVQSSTMFMMACHGEITPKPDAAIFADTGWEPKAVYENIERLKRYGDQYGIPIHVVSTGNIRDDALRTDEKRFATMPLFIKGKYKTPGMLRRQCTSEYKIQPIKRKVRELVGSNSARLMIEQWIGISYDEIQRMKPAREDFITHRWPLIERRMSRQDCMTWMQEHGYPLPPRSSCIGCPFHDKAHWRSMKKNSPDEFQDAVEFDHEIRNRMRLMRSPVYVHPSLKPLDEVDFGEDESEEQRQLAMFDAECTGYCGV